MCANTLLNVCDYSSTLLGIHSNALLAEYCCNIHIYTVYIYCSFKWPHSLQVNELNTDHYYWFIINYLYRSSPGCGLHSTHDPLLETSYTRVPDLYWEYLHVCVCGLCVLRHIPSIISLSFHKISVPLGKNMEHIRIWCYGDKYIFNPCQNT